jgi:hypothetical protein
MESTNFRDGVSAHMASTAFQHKGRKGVVSTNSPHEYDEFFGRAGLHPADSTLLETGIWIKESLKAADLGKKPLLL